MNERALSYRQLVRKRMLDPRASPGARLVWITLELSTKGAAEVCRPSFAALAGHTGYCQKIVRRHLDELRALGWITWRPGFDPQTRKACRYYTLSHGGPQPDMQ